MHRVGHKDWWGSERKGDIVRIMLQQIYICIYINCFSNIYIYRYIYMYVCMYVCTYVCMRVCIYRMYVQLWIWACNCVSSIFVIKEGWIPAPTYFFSSRSLIRSSIIRKQFISNDISNSERGRMTSAFYFKSSGYSNILSYKSHIPIVDITTITTNQILHQYLHYRVSILTPFLFRNI